MQSLVLPPSSFVAPEFGRLRYPGPELFAFNRPRSANARRCTPRDLPLPSPMSSSVPAQDPLGTLGTVRRPGYPDLPPPVATTATITTAGGTVASTSTTGSILSPVSQDSNPAHVSALHRVGTGTRGETGRESFTFTESIPSTRLPPSLTVQTSSQASTATYPQPTFGASTAGPASRALPQKTTRRTKAHVASACVNCKKKHLGCDPARPCRRCVLSNKEATCVDVTHKKRGRPPLKADEGSIRTYATQVDTRGGFGEQGSQPRRSMHRATSSRELRPITDLQMHSSQAGPMGVRLAPGQPQRWPPVVYPHGIDPSLTTQRSMGHRRFSSSGSAQSLTSASPTAYVPVPTGYNPALAAGRISAGVGRPVSSYPSQAPHPVASPPQYHQTYGIPISPYPENTRAGSRTQVGKSPVSRDSREGIAESPVRLPPIYPSPLVNPQPPRPNDLYSTWSPPQPPQESRQQPRRFVEPISPTNQMRHTAPELSYMSQLGTTSPGGQPQNLSVTRTQDGRRESEAEDRDSPRPVKRRKMALDDLVND
ncbi:putative C6 transcription factor [Aspergillus lucknowensis]|uniref:Transcription activator of gluconeogenesis acuK n=1 Tax=Aspergillus lucknowensis TaxID=176173 RepID=A0ABR4LXE8_9EURO